MRKIISLMLAALILTTFVVSAEEQSVQANELLSITEMEVVDKQLNLIYEVHNESDEIMEINVLLSKGLLFDEGMLVQTGYGSYQIKADGIHFVLNAKTMISKEELVLNFTKEEATSELSLSWNEQVITHSFDTAVELITLASTPQKVSIGVSNNTETELYTQNSHSGTVTINGGGLVNTNSTGHILIQVPAEYISSFTVPKADFIKSVTYETIDNVIVAKVVLSDIDPTTQIGFPFTVVYKDRITPDKYTITPEVSYVDQFDSSKNVGVDEVDNTVAFTTKYDTQSIDKYIMSNNQASLRQDGTVIYGGELDAANPAFLSDTDYPVIFQYRAITDRQHSGFFEQNEIKNTRFVDQIIVEDILPQYKDKNGILRTAVFEPSLNPGWVLEGNRVSYTVLKTGDSNKEGADKQLSHIKLKLSFPGAPALLDIQNKVDATYRFMNDPLGEEDTTKSDSITFKFNGVIEENLRYLKNSNDRYRINYDVDGMHLVQSTYVMSLTNSFSYPMKNVVVKDFNYDERYYFDELYINNLPGYLEGNIAIIGIDSNGIETVIVPGGSRYSLETMTRDTIQSQMVDYEKGLITKDDFVIPTRQFETVEVRVINGAELRTGDSLKIHMIMKFIDPLELSISPVAAENKLVNGSHVSLDLNGFPVEKESESHAILYPREERVALTKETIGEQSGGLGSHVSYRIKLNLAGLSPSRILDDSQLIDLLPIGMEYVSHHYFKNAYEYGVEKIEVVDNFNNTGRSAVVVNFNRNRVSDFNSFIMTVTGKITPDMIPSKAETAEINNDNNVYFHSPTLDVSKLFMTNSFVDEYDANMNSDMTDMIIGTSTKTVVLLPEEVRSEKLIHRENVAPSKEVQHMGFEERFDYILRTVNFTNTELNSYTVIDVFPHINDGVSAYSNTLQGPILVDDRFTVYYSFEIPYGEAVGIANSNIWVTEVSDFSLVKAVKIVLNEGSLIKPYGRIEVRIPMKTPTRNEAESLVNFKADNKFYISLNNDDSFGESNTVSTVVNRSIDVQKVWVGKALNRIEVELYRDSNPDEILGNLVLDNSNNYKGKFLDVTPVDEDLETIKDYSIRELGDLDSYEVSLAGNADLGFTVTNTFIREKIEITGSKVWVGGPENKPTIEFQLYRNEIAYGTPVTLENGVTSTVWSDLDKTDSQGVEYIYTIDEVDVPYGYHKSISDNGLNITNTYIIEKMDYTAYKKWVNGPKYKPTIEIQLYQNGEVFSEPISLISGETEHTWTDLPITDSLGHIHIYTVRELTDLEDYSKEIDENIITNTFLITLTDITVKKVWVNAPVKKPTIEIQLERNGEPYGASVELTDGMSETTWYDLPLTDKEGTPYIYSVSELGESSDYDAVVDGFVITNTYIEKPISEKPIIEKPETKKPDSEEPQHEAETLPATGLSDTAGVFEFALILLGILILKTQRKKLD